MAVEIVELKPYLHAKIVKEIRLTLDEQSREMRRTLDEQCEDFFGGETPLLDFYEEDEDYLFPEEEPYPANDNFKRS